MSRASGWDFNAGYRIFSSTSSWRVNSVVSVSRMSLRVLPARSGVYSPCFSNSSKRRSSVSSNSIASCSSADHGSRFVTAATAPATAPRADVAAEDSADGLVAAGRGLDRDAAARAPLFFLATFVLAGPRLVARADEAFFVARLRLGRFAVERTVRVRFLVERVADFFLPELLVAFRLATPASIRFAVRYGKNERRRGAARQVIVAQDPG